MRSRGSAFSKGNPGTCLAMQNFSLISKAEEEHSWFELDWVHSNRCIRQTQSYKIMCTFLLDTQISFEHTGAMKANITTLLSIWWNLSSRCVAVLLPSVFVNIIICLRCSLWECLGTSSWKAEYLNLKSGSNYHSMLVYSRVIKIHRS